MHNRTEKTVGIGSGSLNLEPARTGAHDGVAVLDELTQATLLAAQGIGQAVVRRGHDEL
ncbi:MAG: hypothetical protein GY780_14270, partial [bacterium]|nr:hypothetical protein [bacterium]